MKRFNCILLLVLLLVAAQGCTSIALPDDSSASISAGGTTSDTVSSLESSPADDSSASVSVGDTTSDAVSSPESSAADDSSYAPPESSAVAYEYAIDIDQYLDSIYSENLLLVNKQHTIGESYAPTSLASVSYARYDNVKMDTVAEKALCAFLKEAYYYGYTDVTVTSAYRSYSSQQWYFNYYIEEEMKTGKSRSDAEAVVLTYSARPGTSEHQTGLCIDMHNLPAANQSFGNTEAGKWLAANAHRFGFILRFPQGKENITGYTYEPWHFRFVGIKHASIIYEQGLCLEEYLEMYYPEG